MEVVVYLTDKKDAVVIEVRALRSCNITDAIKARAAATIKPDNNERRCFMRLPTLFDMLQGASRNCSKAQAQSLAS